MKKFIVVCALFGLIACNSSGSGSGTSASRDSAGQKPVDPDVKKGLNLVAGEDCFGCHNVSDQLRGPAYEAVADRYKDSSGAIVDTLAQRIIKGSAGRWTTGDAMTAHPSLSPEDAKLMVKYVLSLKK